MIESRLLVPSRETVTAAGMNDSVVDILWIVRDFMERYHPDHAAGWYQTARDIALDIPRTIRQAHSTGEFLGLPDSVLNSRRETYGRLLDHCEEYVVEEAERKRAELESITH